MHAGDRLVARSHACDHPPSIAALPAVTRSALAPGLAPRAIDDAVRAAPGPLIELDATAIAALTPDLVVTQSVCGVCAAHADAVRAAAPGCRILELNAETLEGVLDDALRLGDAAGVPDAAAALVVALRTRILTAQDHVNQFVEGPVVGFLEWADPLYCAGHWTVQMIERAGGRHPLNPCVPKPRAGAAAGPMQSERVAGRSVPVPVEAFCATRPSVVVVAPCGLDLEHAEAQGRALLERADMRALGAAWYAVDGRAMFNRPGPRLVDAFEFLVALLADRPERSPEGFPVVRLA